MWGLAAAAHSMKLSTHCSWAALKITWLLEVCSYRLCWKLASSAHYMPQHPWPCFVVLHDLPLSFWPSQLLPLCVYVYTYILHYITFACYWITLYSSLILINSLHMYVIHGYERLLFKNSPLIWNASPAYPPSDHMHCNEWLGYFVLKKPLHKLLTLQHKSVPGK